ncbi:hypothetical protein KY308_04135, partial [Candidatus Woesearchaeota archaeon]|nr:hypothetical protein [Candidatus Woesearchaeota archaeon]
MKKIIYIIIIAFAVLAIPLFYRVHAADNTIPGQEIYYHLRAVETSGDTDTLVYNERPFYRFNYYYFLKGLSWLNLDVRIASVILGILSCVLLFLIISKISAETKTAFYALIMFALSPAFIYAFDTGSSETLCLFLILLGSLLLIGRKTHYFAIIPFILSIKNIFSVVIILAILFSFFMWKKERKISFTLMTAAVVTYAILIKPSFFVNYVYSELNTVAQMFSDIGGLYGISIFAAIFAILGFFFMKKRVYLYLLILVLIVSFFINNQTI